MRLLALVFAALLVGCAGGERTASLKIGEAVYWIPHKHILSLTGEPHQFVRVKDPERRFELVYDSRTQGKDDARGWPVLFSLNDGRAPQIERHSNKDLEVVCRRAVNPRGGCGVRISHQGADWAVLFPRAHFGAAQAIRDQALEDLKAYET
ncbi:MAG: hypothetical protein ACR2JJ_02145 [Sphingomicrobium sp.]